MSKEQITHTMTFMPPANINDWVMRIMTRLSDNKEYTIEIKEKSNNRSSNQNRYLWGVVYPILGEKLGYDNETIHEVLKTKFGEKVVLRNNMTINKSTSKYSTMEFENYIQKITIFAGEFLKLTIPSPNETYEENR